MAKPNLRLKSRIVRIFGTQGKFSKKIPQTETIISAVIYGKHPLDDTMKSLWAKKLRCKVEDIF